MSTIHNVGSYYYVRPNPLKEESKPMKLIDYIQEHHGGNVSDFARSRSILPYQVNRWLERGCEMRDNGEIWCKTTKQVKANKAGE